MNNLKHILTLSFLVLAGTYNVHAQIPEHFDQDVWALRSTVIPDFHCIADDYVQYAPAALMVGLKACGYQGRSGWGHMLTADAFSVAIMTGVTQGMKYSIRRMRPDNSRRNSFPSGHSGTAFLTATMLHKEYGWRSPWWSIGGYTAAAFTGISRILNNKHWMSDIMAGAAIGIGSVHLGYYLSDLIFKDRFINPAYEKPTFSYDPSLKHYVASFYFARRFIIGRGRDYFTNGTVMRGGSAGLSADIPIKPGVGVTARLGANSLTYSTGATGCSYNTLVGGYFNMHWGKRFEGQFKAMAGTAWNDGRYFNSPADRQGSLSTTSRIGADVCAGFGFSFMLDENFKIGIFADYDAIGSARGRWLHSALTGWSAAWLW